MADEHENVETSEQPSGSDPTSLPAAEPAEEPSPEVETRAPDEPAQQPDADATPATEPGAEQVPAGEPVAEESARQARDAAPKRGRRAAKPQPAAKTGAPKAAQETRAAGGRRTADRAVAERPERPRGRRQERRGVVVSAAMEKTIVVKVDTIKAHPKYKKVVRRSAKFHAHDEANNAKVGDVVRIVETRPLSATKRWRLAEVIEAAR